MRSLALLRQILRTIRRDESGQSLIVIVSAMTVLLGVAGFAIDAANWMVRHHDAQVVADSAALAAAQCLANPGQSSQIEVAGKVENVPACTSATDIQNAQTVAVAYAAANGVTISPSDVTLAHKIVTVSASTTAPSGFARVMGIGATSQMARAGASWTPSGCTTPGQNCDFMFANSSSCGSNAIDVATQGAATVNGDIQTNGFLDASETGNGGGIYGSGNYGSSCPVGSYKTSDGNHDPWHPSDPTQASQAMTWPIDYSKDFPACTGTAGTNPCGGSGFPSYCTNTSTSVTGITLTGANGGTPQPGNVYCASGPPPANPADPSTWTGTITIATSGNNTFDDTFVAGTINYSGAGGDTISACGYTATGYSPSSCTGSGSGSPPAPAGGTSNYPIFYAVGNDPNSTACAAAGTNSSTACALSLSSVGNLTLNGDVFVKNGTANLSFQGNQSAGDTFIEANMINANLAGNFNGDGPPPGGGSGSSSGGTVSLVQ